MCIGPPSIPVYYSIPPMVYPHVYGATYPSSSGMSSSRGLSPCVWGHLLLPYHLTVKIGSIPMCMGPPLSYPILTHAIWVYPQGYGATGKRIGLSWGSRGRSPGGWGDENETGSTRTHRAIC